MARVPDTISPQVIAHSEPEGPNMSERNILARIPWLWTALAIALCVKTYLEPINHSVYPVFEAGGLSWRADRDLYVRSDFEFEYSPPFAAAFAPLTHFTTAFGGCLWSVLNVVLLCWALRALIRDVFPDRWTARQQWLFSILVAVSSLRGFWAAQSNMLVFALIAGAASAIARRRWWAAAFLLAIPIFVKVWPVAAAMLLMACWPRQLIGRMAVSCTAIAAFPLLTRPASIVLWQYGNYFEALSGPIMKREPYRDFWMLWEVLYPPVLPAVYLGLQLAMALAALGLCLWQVRRAPSERHALTFILGIWCVWQLAFGPGVERNTICLIAPMMSWGLITSLQQPESRVSRGVMFAAFTVTTLFSFGAFERLLKPTFPAVLGALPVGVLLFATWLVIQARRTSGDCSVQPAGVSLAPGPADSSATCTAPLRKRSA